MISFKQFITEDSNDIQRLIDALKTDCQPFLKAIDFKPQKYQLWRGSPDFLTKGFFRKVSVRKDRYPLDTLHSVHTILDDWFKTQFGHKFRSQAIFGAGSKTIANIFGDPFLAFPIGKFDYCWSKEYPDLTDAVEKYLGSLVIRAGNKISAINQLITNDEHFLDEFMEGGDWQYNKGLKEALYEYSKHEIMIECDSYYLVNSDALSSSNWDDIIRAIHP